jgi:hypothetical protein
MAIQRYGIVTAQTAVASSSALVTQHPRPCKNDDPEMHRLLAVDVLITIAGRSALTCVCPVQHSGRPSLDNCFRDQAVTNARQLAGLLSGVDASVVMPGAAPQL